MTHSDNPQPTKFRNVPGAYYFGLSYASDMKFAGRLYGKSRQQFIEAVKKAWRVK